jgi:hypothetical protein
MTRAIAHAFVILAVIAWAYLIFTAVFPPAHAAGNAPDGGWAIAPEGQAAYVTEAEVQNEAWWLRRGVTQDQLLWAVFDGGSPDLAPAPVPVPPAGLLMLSGLLILTLLRKG